MDDDIAKLYEHYAHKQMFTNWTEDFKNWNKEVSKDQLELL